MSTAEYQKKYLQTKKGLSYRIYSHQKQTEKTRGIAVRYTLSEFREWFFDQERFGFLYWSWVAHGYDRWKSPSVDRINSSKDYSFGNIQLMSWKENWKKGHIDIIKRPIPANKSGTTGVFYLKTALGRKKWMGKLYVKKRPIEKKFLSFAEALSFRRSLEKEYYGLTPG